jgi:hypothetical protein
MRTWIHAIDNLLRGETTRLSRLRAGSLDIPAGGLTVLIIVLGAFHGSCMGWMGLFNRDAPSFGQLFASMVKVPSLFLLTLVVTFPSLYVFNALVGSRFALTTLFRLLIAAVAVTLAVLASFGPIVAFFSLTTTNYPFMVLLNVLVAAIAGVLGLTFLMQTLHRLTLLESADSPLVTPVPSAPGAAKPAVSEPTAPAAAPTEPAGALEGLRGSVLGKNVKTVFVCWIVVFALVGAQMSWVLRPFIGNPEQPFEWFRARESNFFEAVGRALVHLFW